MLVAGRDVDGAVLQPAGEDGEGVVVDVEAQGAWREGGGVVGESGEETEWVVRRWVGMIMGWREEGQRIVISEGWVGRGA